MGGESCAVPLHATDRLTHKVIVTRGGLLGLLLGASILSLVEVVEMVLNIFLYFGWNIWQKLLKRNDKTSP